MKTHYWLLVVALAAAILCLSRASAEHDALFRYIPVLNVITVPNSDQGCQYVAEQLCRATGSYIAADTTEAVHSMIAETAGAARADTWYSFLGADTTIDAVFSIRHNLSLGVSECNRGLTQPWTTVSQSGQVSRIRLATYLCIWRWRSGRWLDMTDIDYPSMPPPLAVSRTYTGTGYGVAFAYGNYYLTHGPMGSDFVTYFNRDGSAPGGVTLTANTCGTQTNCAFRPGAATGRQLMSVGQGSAFTWSDGTQSGGYIYERLNLGYSGVLSQQGATGAADEAITASSALIAKHLTVCMMYSPSLYDKELWNTSSQLQSVWWAIYLVFLFVICLVFFIVVACCQEREDMDEPPEDAPEWAEQEVNNTQKPKRVVSQRSFRQHPDDDLDDESDKYDELDNSEDGNPFQGRSRSGRVSWQ